MIQYKYMKMFIAILQHSVMIVQKFILKDVQIWLLFFVIEQLRSQWLVQFNKMTEKNFKFKFHEFSRQLMKTCQCIHWLCSDLCDIKDWKRQLMQLFMYLCQYHISPDIFALSWSEPGSDQKKVLKNYFILIKHSWRYNTLLQCLMNS